MNFRTKTIIFLFAVLVFFSFQKEIALAGFGVSPSSVFNQNLIPGSFYEQDIFLVQSQPDVDLNAVVTINAGAINKWIKIENGNSFVIPKGTQQFLMKVDVAVPPDAKLGEYKGAIMVSTSPAGEQKSGVSVTLGADIGVDLNVTEIKVSDFSIQNFQIKDTLKGSPVDFMIKVKNEGNVENGPSKVGLTFFDQYHSTQLGFQEEPITEKVPSFESKNISVSFPNNLDIGHYWADVKIYSGDQVIADSKIVFSIVGPVAVKITHNSLALLNFSMFSSWIYMLVIVAAVILILIAVIVFTSHKNKK